MSKASIELELLDSVSHEQVAAFINIRSAKEYDWTHGAGQAATKYLAIYSTWAYTKEAMDRQAQMIREGLDTAHSKTSDRVQTGRAGG